MTTVELAKAKVNRGAKSAAGDAAQTGRAACIFSVDVEDWFHILDVPSSPAIDKWASLPSHVEKDFRHLLDMFDRCEGVGNGGVKVTCFFLAWVAERFPHLVKEAAARGHEIASHGYAHRLVYQCTADEFHDDVTKARDILQNITGKPVLGYRSPGFSCTADVPWFFDKLVEAGYRYDSSVFPAARGHGGMADAQLAPHVISAKSGRLAEFPITVTDMFGKRLCLFGGGYLRLFPSWMIHRGTRQVLREDRPVVFYIHPREINPTHPRLPMSFKRRFKTYINLKTTEPKIRKIFSEFQTTTFEQYLEQHPDLAA